MDKWIVSYEDRYGQKLYFVRFQPVKFLPYGERSIDDTVIIFDDEDKAKAVALLIDGKVEEI